MRPTFHRSTSSAPWTSPLLKCAAIATLSLAGAAASAQQRPGGYGGRQQTGPQGRPPMEQQALPPVPPVDATPLTQANAAVAKAKTDLKKAQAVLFAAAKRFEKTIDAKPDVQAAMQQLTVAQGSLQAETATVMGTLKSSTTYKEAQEKAQASKADVEKLRATPDATPDQRYAAAQASLAANAALSKIETTAMAADPKIAEARAKVATLSDSLKQLRSKYESGMHEDAQWTAASKDVADKQAVAEAADKQLADARKTVADRQAAHQAAVAARNKAEADNAAQNGGYGAPAGVLPGAPPAGR